MTELEDPLQRLLITLEGQPFPLSFLDVLPLTSMARARADWLSSDDVRRLVALAEGSSLTRGGRTALSDLLRWYTSRTEKQRALARRVLGLKDTGKATRVAVGQDVAVELPRRPKHGAWRVLRIEGPAQIGHREPIRPMEADHFSVALKSDGPAMVRWCDDEGGDGSEDFVLLLFPEL